MEFLNKPMSEVWKATKRTFNEIMEINSSDLNAAAASGNQEDRRSQSTNMQTISGTTPIHIPQNSSQTRFKSQGKTTSLPRLQRPPSQPVGVEDYVGIINPTDGNDEDEVDAVGGSWCTVDTFGHASRSRSPDSWDGHSVSMQPRSRYRSNSSDRASMRSRNELEDAMVNRYHRSTSYDKAMDNADEEEEEEEDQSDKVKTKLMSMWNNMKYGKKDARPLDGQYSYMNIGYMNPMSGWTVKSKTAFSLQKPIWFLGKCYQHRPSDPEPMTHPGMESVKSPQMELFKQDFTSRIWMTYRREFPQLEGSTLTTDCGWGCMLRSGQMLLAQCLVTHFMGRDWNVYKEQTKEMEKYHHEIIRWFGDQPSDMSPFSVHRLVDIGKNSGKKAGDWYGPASVAHILRDAMDTAPELNPLFEQVCMYVAQDCTVYKQDVLDLCRSKYQGSPKPVYKDRPLNCIQHTNSRDDLHNGQHSNPNQPRGRETLINGHCREDTKHNTCASGQMPSHNPPADSRRASCDTKTRKVKQSVNNTPVTQTSYRHAGSGQRTISHNTFGHSNSNSREYTVTSNQVYNGRCSTGNSTSQDTSGCVNRTNPENRDGNVRRVRDNTEHLICRRNAVKESKQGTPYVWSKNSSRLKSSKSDNNWECILPPDYDECVEQDLSSQKCKSQAKSHNSPVDEPIWRRQSADNCLASSATAAAAVQIQPSKETEINGHCTETDEKAVDQQKPNRKEKVETSESEVNKWCALILLVPVRLGGDEINPIYITPLRSLFTLESCMGIIGGKPKHSLYYVGFQDEKLIHLDPHYCQPVVDMKSRAFPTYSFHCMSPRKMRITSMDPSCTVGFYLKTEKDFEDFCQTISEVVTPSKNSGDYPMFIVREGHCSDWHDSSGESDNKKDRFLRIRHIDQDGRLIAPLKESEDFVFLES